MGKRTQINKMSAQKKNYSLNGEEAIHAVQKGLAEATWYTAPVPRDKMRALLVRKDGPAIRDTIIWFGLIGGSGYIMYALWGTWWCLIPMLIYSVLYASSSDSRWHESSHGTAFKTDWMNNWLYEVASFMVFRQSVSWRWSHTRHHSDTIIVGRDPEIAVPRPPDIKGIIMNLFAFKSFPREFRRWMLHIVGRIDAQERQYIPESEFGKVFMVARVWMIIYLAVIGLAIYLQSWLPLFYVGFPTLIGSYMIVVYGLTQHAGLAENVLDHRLNCRTVYMNRIHRFLYWNMNYHLEHHMFPLVPYHNLPELHALIRDYCPKPYNGLIGAYREIIPALLRQAKEPSYFVQRQLPTDAVQQPNSESHRFASSKSNAVNGKLKVCAANELAKGEVIRFDCDGDTYAIYHTDDGKYYATDGICTHGSTHLSDGLIIGKQIECPKHNGRFSIVDGSVQRPPVCAALRTYEVTNEHGQIWINASAAGGIGQLETTLALDYKVVSNKNIATFIKELVLEPVDGPFMKYKPGEYIQLEIPVYNAGFDQLKINAPYDKAWREENLFRLHATNLTKTRRNYSMATNPDTDIQLKFNVRIALPPDGLNCSAGVGSSYVYSLQPGDYVKVMGPFGDFHIKETNREMVYIGGGAGMAPLRSHIAYLFESKNTDRKVSFWYGARSAQEMFYSEYFEALEKKYRNFGFHVALSESLEDDNWNGHTGFIHEVVFNEYLSGHKDIANVEFYLCGPPAMIEACQNMLANAGVSPEQVSFDEF